MTFEEIIIDIGKRMYQAGFVAGNDGNISIRTGENSVLATPSGVSKGFMTGDMLVTVDMEGNVIKGDRKPSSELKMHLAAYRQNTKLKSVCHAHPPVSTALGIAGIPVKLPILAETVLTLGEVPVLPYMTLGSKELADGIIPYCTSHGGVILAHHGLTTWADDPYTAYYRMESVEHYAKIYMYCKQLGQLNVLDKKSIEELIAQRDKFGIDITAGPFDGNQGKK